MRRDTASLRETQAQFYDWVARGARVAPEKVALLVIANDGMVPAERVGVYARMYFDRIVLALAEVFPMLASIVGDEVFRKLVADYLRIHPPGHPMLQRAGSHFPAFAASSSRISNRPWLAELARLEWARFYVVDAPDSEPLCVERLRSLDANGLVELPLRFVAAHAIVESEHSVDELWRAIHDRRAPRAPRRCSRPISILVWRRDVVVMHRHLAPFEARIARLAQAGATFGDACELAAREKRSVADVSRRVFEAVGQFVADRVIATAPRNGADAL